MEINLADIWDTDGEPKSESYVDGLFDNYIGQLRHALETLIAEKQPDKKPGIAASLIAEVHVVLRGVSTHIAKARTGTSAEHIRVADQLRNFSSNLRSWCSVIVTSAGEAAANARTRVADAGSWAMHYSTVRMTISTFFIGISWGVVSLKWNEYSPELGRAALWVWILTGVFLVLFTLLLDHAGARQEAYKKLVEPVKPQSTEQCWTWLLPRWLWSKWLRYFLAVWSPVVIYGILSWGFCRLLDEWAHHDAKTPVTRTSLVEEANIQNVRLSEWGAKIDAIAESLNQIRAKLPQPTPTVTPTPTPTPAPKPSRRKRRHRKGTGSTSPTHNFPDPSAGVRSLLRADVVPAVRRGSDGALASTSKPNGKAS